MIRRLRSTIRFATTIPAPSLIDVVRDASRAIHRLLAGFPLHLAQRHSNRYDANAAASRRAVRSRPRNSPSTLPRRYPSAPRRAGSSRPSSSDTASPPRARTRGSPRIEARRVPRPRTSGTDDDSRRTDLPRPPSRRAEFTESAASSEFSSSSSRHPRTYLRRPTAVDRRLRLLRLVYPARAWRWGVTPPTSPPRRRRLRTRRSTTVCDTRCAWDDQS